MDEETEDTISMEDGNIQDAIDGKFSFKLPDYGNNKKEYDPEDESKFIGNLMLNMSTVLVFADPETLLAYKGVDRVEAVKDFYDGKIVIDRNSGYNFGEGHFDDLPEQFSQYFLNATVNVVYIKESELSKEKLEEIYDALGIYYDSYKSIPIKYNLTKALKTEVKPS